jgi:hypothetical protein
VRLEGEADCPPDGATNGVTQTASEHGRADHVRPPPRRRHRSGRRRPSDVRVRSGQDRLREDNRTIVMVALQVRYSGVEYESVRTGTVDLNGLGTSLLLERYE